MRKSAQQSVQRTGGSLRDLQTFFWLRAFSTSQAFSYPAHTQVTPAVETVEKGGESNKKP